MKNLNHSLSNKIQTILLVSFFVGALTFFVSSVMPAKYQAKGIFFILPAEPEKFSDAQYFEYVGNILEYSILTEEFQEKVNTKMQEFESTELSLADAELIKSGDIGASQLKPGVIEIKVNAPTMLLAKDAAKIVGVSIKEELSVIDNSGKIAIKESYSSKTDVIPSFGKIILNTLIGFVIGFVLSLFAVLAFKNFQISFYREKKQSSLNLKLPEEEREATRTESFSGLAKFAEKISSYGKEQLDKIVASSDQIEGYKIEEAVEKKPLKEEKREENEAIPKQEPVQEGIKVIESGAKATAPDNLPIFIEAEEPELPFQEPKKEGEDELEELNISLNKAKKEEIAPVKESTEEEIKKRLNKLLKGEL